MAGSRKAAKAAARKFYLAIEQAADALDELIDLGDPDVVEDILEDVAEDLVDDAQEIDAEFPRRAWLEQVASFVLLQSVKVDLTGGEEEEEEDDDDGDAEEIEPEDPDAETEDDEAETEEEEEEPPPPARGRRSSRPS